MKLNLSPLVLLILAGGPVCALAQTVELEPVATGLVQPVLVTHARDASGRLFIVEQRGVISVLPRAGASPARFLDIETKVLDGGERGLLGLAFHPQFASNGRFFVDYTRRPDGATVIAEYHVSATDPDSANPSETVLLVIPQPEANHNGGMVEFGPDGFLYIGMGDGGGANDPGNRAQNSGELLGKILRIDVDHAAGGSPYGIPPTNPFAGSGNARGEIYAIGLRNPWRFSFDRGTGQLYVGDVGQNQIEEIDIVAAGGNYGWRVFEGTRCTGLGPSACSSGGFVPPIAEYAHDGGRCSVTGGNVYRGRLTTFPAGTYVYGDYCSGEIFQLSGGTSSILLDTNLNISSFGEDEDGEIYVSGHTTGTVYRIVNPNAAAIATLYFPWLSTSAENASQSSEHSGFAVANLDTAAATVTLTAFDPQGNEIAGNGITNPRTVTLAAGEQIASVDTQLFGAGLPAGGGIGWVQMESTTPRIASFFLAFDSALNLLDGADIATERSGTFVLPELEPHGVTRVRIANPGLDPLNLTMDLMDANGDVRTTAARVLPPRGVVAATAAELFPGFSLNASDYMRGTAVPGAIGFELLGVQGRHSRGLNGQDAAAGAVTLYAPQYVSTGPYRSVLSIVNLEGNAGNVTMRFRDDSGRPIGEAREIQIAARGKILVSDPSFFGNLDEATGQGYVEISSNGPRLSGSISFSDPDQSLFAASLPLVRTLERNLVFSQVASDATYFTGIALLNPSALAASARIEILDRRGSVIASDSVPIAAGGRVSRLITEYFPALAQQQLSGGYIRIAADQPLAGFALFGTRSLSALSAIPAQRIPE